MDEKCEHGAEGFCMLCCRENEGKSLKKDKGNSIITLCSTCNEPYNFEHRFCDEREE